MEMFEMCRTCLTTQGVKVPMDDNFIGNYNLLTNLNVTHTDEMPHYVCQACMDAIIFFIKFREKAIISEKTLKKLYVENIKLECNANCENPTLEGAVVKLELKQEQYDDQDFFEIGFETFECDDEDVINSNDVKCKRSKRVANQKNQLALAYNGNDDNIPELICEIKPKRSKVVKQKKLKPLKTDDKEDDVELHCGLCPMTFEDIDLMQKHVGSHEKDGQCSLCGELFCSRYQTFAHRILHMPAKQMRCHICNKKFLTVVTLEWHYMKIHYGETGQMMCKFCSKSFANPNKLRKHIWSTHAQQYHCDICSAIIKTKSYLRLHMLKHEDKKNYFCDQCDYQCKMPSGLRTHYIRKHAVNKMTCGRCGNCFENKEKHDKHKCSNVIGIICPTCGKHIKNQKCYQRHLRSHSTSLNYPCPRCPAKFKTSGGLKTHIDRHDGNKTYQCEHCQRRFYSCSVLIKHRRIHTGEKPYVCKVCNKGFTGNNNLKLHMRVHGEYLIVKKDKLADDETSVESPQNNKSN